MNPVARERTFLDMTTEIDELALWEQARAGDGRAFAQLFDLHHPRVYGRALRETQSVSDAEDVTAIVFLECWKRRSSIRPGSSIIGWLLLTTTNTTRNLTRSRRRHRALLEQLPPPAPHPDHADAVAAALDQDVEAERVRTAMEKLSAQDREVLTLCVVEGNTVPEAAARLSLPAATVKTRLARARKRLSTQVALQSSSVSREVP